MTGGRILLESEKRQFSEMDIVPREIDVEDAWSEVRPSTMTDICSCLSQSAERTPFATAQVSLVRLGLGLIELALLADEASKRHGDERWDDGDRRFIGPQGRAFVSHHHVERCRHRR